MGNRCYLNICRDNDEQTLFEANNSLPFFWIGMLDVNILKRYEDIWRQVEKLIENNDGSSSSYFTDVSPDPTSIVIERVDFEKNISRTHRFLEKHFNRSIDLFTDFETYIRSVLTDGPVVMDIIEMANLTSVDLFLNSLFREILAIENDNPQAIDFLNEDDLITSGTGYTTALSSNFSSYYHNELEYRRHAPILKINTMYNQRIFNLRALLRYSLTMVISLSFSYILYRAYLKEGFSFLVILAILCNLCLYILSMYGIKNEMRAYLRKRSMNNLIKDL